MPRLTNKSFAELKNCKIPNWNAVWNFWKKVQFAFYRQSTVDSMNVIYENMNDIYEK